MGRQADYAKPGSLRDLTGTPLTAREVEVLSLVARGLRNHEIARTLFVADETVKTHLRHILAKLEANNRTHAVALWLRPESAPDIANVLIERAKNAPERAARWLIGASSV